MIGTNAIKMDIATTGRRPVTTPMIHPGSWLRNLRKNTFWVNHLTFEMIPTTAVGMAQKTIKAITNATVAV